MLSHLRFHRRGPSNPTSPIPPDSSPWDTAQLVPDEGIPAPEIRPRSSNSLPFAHPPPAYPAAYPAAQPPAYPPPPRSSSPQSSSSPSSSQIQQPQYQQQHQQHQHQHQQAPILPPIARVTSNGSDFSLDFGDTHIELKDPQPQSQPQPQPQPQPQRQSLAEPLLPLQSQSRPSKPRLSLQQPSHYYQLQEPQQQQQQQQQQKQQQQPEPQPQLQPKLQLQTQPQPQPQPETQPESQSQSQPRDDPPRKSSVRSPFNEETGFIGGLALQNYRREQEALLNAGLLNRDDGYVSDSQSHTSSRPHSHTRATKAASTYIPPTHHPSATGGKRPAGMRMGSEPQALAVQSMSQDPPRGKKGLPFLKNPMSTLLLRRKSSQTVLPELALSLQKEQEPVYDPRIRGTRVHDFSAPRPRPPMRIHDPAHTATEKAPGQDPSTSASDTPPLLPPKDDRSNSSKRTSFSGRSQDVHPDVGATAENKQDALSRDPTIISHKRRSLMSSRRKSSMPASLASMSRNTSAASSKGMFSSIPKHMKSTSSRFSFDMIGAAKQEKILEERHRQRQQDRQGDGEDEYGPRDSRFDDFDEDAFDYDALDYDDGLEERIPGVNADFDEEDDLEAFNDPDNDQENFAGFTFQRSDPTSTLTSPRSAGLLPTPRDVDGDVIGYASAGISGTPEPQPDTLTPTDASCIPAPLKSPRLSAPTGLGIQDLGTGAEPAKTTEQQQQQPPAQVEYPNQKDELYFNDGLIHDFDGEGDGSAFDESIFDLDDTDQYGRPIPGMFAKALSQRTAAQETKKRESDMTSRLSQQSGVTHSTAHTSLSVDQQPKPVPEIPEVTKTPERAPEPQTQAPDWTTEPQDSVVAYQAALAAAAHQAAASGKFRRDSSPGTPADLTVTSPTTCGSAHSDPRNENALEDYEYDDGGYTSAGLDDYELDDDAIIAEANASALANDTDGWYGQEFGFYSAPLSSHNHHAPSSTALSEKNLFQYSHGGYFGPSGVNRTVSGRVVSREPNLTPITERSEYSNRNSLMSLMPPNANPNNPAAAAAVAPLQSPGLAQLAMMGSSGDDDSMSLSALLRFRNKAWGTGSQASATSSRDGSPYDRNNGATSPWDQQQQQDYHSPHHHHGRKNSAFSLWSQDSGAGAGSAGSGSSPTMTMSMSMSMSMSNTIPMSSFNPNAANASRSPKSNHEKSASPPPPQHPQLYSSPPPPPQYSHASSLTTACPPVLEDEETDDAYGDGDGDGEEEPAMSPAFTNSALNSASGGAANSKRHTAPPVSMNSGFENAVDSQRKQYEGKGHKHKGSADSVSYMREEEENEGAPRWVMERRRTADSGEIEVLAREVIDRGRI